MEKIEPIEEQLVVTASFESGLEPREAGHSVVPQRDQLTIQHRRLDGLADRSSGRPPAYAQPHPWPLRVSNRPTLPSSTVAQQAIAVELDLGNPLIAIRRLRHQRTKLWCLGLRELAQDGADCGRACSDTGHAGPSASVTTYMIEKVAARLASGNRCLRAPAHPFRIRQPAGLGGGLTPPSSP